MTAPAAIDAPRTSLSRDAAVDLVKAFCLIVVVVLHVLMAGVVVGPHGLTLTNALAGNPVFAWSTWGVQVMPLFFLLGGFSSITEWRHMRAAGATDADYVRKRVNRLARPAVLPIALVGGVLTALAVAGVPADQLKEAGFRIGQPLWFLAVYIGCCAFVPLMTRLHEKARITTLATLLAAALTIDTISVTFHLPGVSALNFLFVWLFIQQLGFWAADGFFARLPRLALLGGTIASFGTLVFLTLVVGYSTDMYVNLNPPTTCILVLGIGQIFLFSFARPVLDRLATARVMVAASAVNRNSMTIYLWHVPVVVIVSLSMIGARMAMPEPLTRTWWETRPMVFVFTIVLLVPLVVAFARWERTQLRLTQTRTPAAIAALKVVFAVAGVGIILVVGFTPVVSWVIGLSLLLLAVWLGPPPMRVFQPKKQQTFD